MMKAAHPMMMHSLKYSEGVALGMCIIRGSVCFVLVGMSTSGMNFGLLGLGSHPLQRLPVFLWLLPA